MGKERILFSKEIKVERIDKIIASQTNYSRKDVKKLISQKKVRVNDEIVKRPEQKFDEQQDTIYIDENKLDMKKHIYLVLNKPQGYISATEDRTAKTVLDLVPEQYMRKGLFPAGRLDKDTTGMMIITDDGEFAHNILAPRKHIEKTYRVQIDIDITEEMKEKFKQGIVLKDHVCCPATIVVENKNTALITITEGKYHQIKKMFLEYYAGYLWEIREVSLLLFLLDIFFTSLVAKKSYLFSFLIGTGILTVEVIPQASRTFISM